MSENIAKGVVEAGGNLANKAANWTPTGVIQVLCMVLLAALLAVFAALLWVGQMREERTARETREMLQALTREAGAREELRRVECAAEREKDRAFQRERDDKLLVGVTAAIEKGVERAIERALKAKGQP